ncbi:hypothetical protein [Pectobacterium versatile]|uniref:hypothetical protein n=1 Tax=Pectobacterium versatile TaxID=2488639 RepID=UPI003017C04E
MKKFLENVGNASTSVSFNGKRIGYNVNAVAYTDGDKIIIDLETNGAKWHQAHSVVMTQDEYEEFCQPHGRQLFIRGIELFPGAEVMLGGSAE